MNTDAWSDLGQLKGTEVSSWCPPSSPVAWKAARAAVMMPRVIPDNAQGVSSYRWSLERGIAVRFKAMEGSLLFHGLSHLLSAAGMKVALPR